MALEGTLKDFSLADIFQLIGLQRKTGILTLQSEIDTVTVTFLDGKIVGAESVEKKLEDRLGRVLVKRNYISEEQLMSALETQKETLQRLGYILIKNNVISQEELKKALHDQINQILFRLFRWKEGYYHFRQEKTVHYDKENITPLSAENILMAGVQIVDEWPRIEKKIPSFDIIFIKTALPPGTRIETKHEEEEDADFTLLEEAVEEVPEDVDDGATNIITLTHEEELAFALVDGERSVQAIIDACHQGEFETLKALYTLLNTELIEPKDGVVKEKIVEEVEESWFDAVKGKLIYVVLLAIVVLAYIFIPFNPIDKMKDTLSGFSNIFNPSMKSDLEVLRELNNVRVDKVHFAIKIYYLNNRSFPDSVQILVDEKYLSPQDVVDVWGNFMTLQGTPDGFLLRSNGPDELPKTTDDIIVDELGAGFSNQAVFFPIS